MSNIQYLYIDFEFKNSNEADMKLIAVSMRAYQGGVLGEPDTFWLQDEDSYVQARGLIYSYIIEDFVFVAYSSAEAECLIQMGFDPREMRWIDLMLEYKMINNKNYSSQHGSCGKHLIKTPSGTNTYPTLLPPANKWDRVEPMDGYSYNKVQFGLENAVYKFLGVKPEEGLKKRMYALILDQDEWTEEEKKEILVYCAGDVHEMHDLHKAMYQSFARKELLHFKKSKNPNAARDYVDAAIKRGEYSARNAIMQRKGYPVNLEAMVSFANSVADILAEIQKELAETFPEVNPFSYIKKTGLYKMNQKKIRDYISSNFSKDDWMLTEKGDYSLSLDAFAKHFDSKGESFGDRFLYFLKTKQNLNGFTADSKKASIFDNTGKDGRVRPYMNVYGSQSSRSQPSSRSFIPLKAKWMRSLIQPAEGRCIIECDYASQEFLVAALMSGDKKMIEAYRSGDPYLALGKLSGEIPMDGTKKSHPVERGLFKTLTLGVSYLMSKYGMAKGLQAKGYDIDEEGAQDLIDVFDNTYSGYTKFKDETRTRYEVSGKLETPCGWVMFGDNDNFRSVCNFPVQGFSASIMRKAVEAAQDKYNLDVIATIHDALMFEVDSDIDSVKNALEDIHHAMIEGFRHYFIGTESYEDSELIRLDFDCWSPDWDGQSVTSDRLEIKAKVENIHIPEGYEKEYNRFSKYFDRFSFLD